MLGGAILHLSLPLQGHVLQPTWPGSATGLNFIPHQTCEVCKPSMQCDACSLRALDPAETLSLCICTMLKVMTVQCGEDQDPTRCHCSRDLMLGWLTPFVKRNSEAWAGSKWKRSKMAAATSGSCPDSHAFCTPSSLASGSSHFFRWSISFMPAPAKK